MIIAGGRAKIGTAAQFLTDSRPVIWVLGAAMLVVAAVLFLILRGDSGTFGITTAPPTNEDATQAPIQPSPAPTTPDATASSTGGRIGLDQTVTGELLSSEAHSWIFDNGPATINILFDAGAFADGVILVFDPQGNQLQYVDANHADGKEQLLNLQIPDARDYSILVTQAQPRLSRYELGVQPSATP